MKYCHTSFGCDCAQELADLQAKLDDLVEIAQMVVRAHDGPWGSNGDGFGVWFSVLRAEVTGG